MKGDGAMGAYATCDFPMVDKWKEMGDKNPVVGFIDSILSGYAQIAFSDNPVTGLLLLIGCYVGSVQQATSGLWAALVATALAYILGVPKLSIRLGLYTFNAALAGLGVALFVFPGQGVTAGLILYSTVAAICCVALTAGFGLLLSPYNVPSLALPYCTTLFVLIPASLLFVNLNPTTSVIPYLGQLAQAEEVVWTAGNFFTAVMNNFAEVLWQANWMSGAFFLAGVIVSSRVDFISAIIASVVATLVAMGLGLAQSGIMIGLYGYNAVLLMMVLFGRGYEMSPFSFIFSLVLACISVVVSVWLTGIFASLGAAVTAFPYAIMAIVAMAGRNAYTKLRFVDPLKWGVPETIAKALKAEKAQK